LAGIAKLGPLLLLPLCGGDSMFENEANTEKSRAKKWRELMS